MLIVVLGSESIALVVTDATDTQGIYKAVRILKVAWGSSDIGIEPRRSETGFGIVGVCQSAQRDDHG